MTSRSMSEGRHERHSGRGRRMLWLQAVGLLLSALLAVSWPVARAAEAEAEPVLEAVDISPLSGNRLQLRFRLSGRLAAPPSAFTINEPARIVLDFLGTRNGLSTRQQAINVGVAERISVLEGADRTRASLNLAQLVPYQMQVQGNAVLLTLDNAGTASTRTLPNSAAASVKAAAKSRPSQSAPAPVVTSGPRNISDLSFRRGPTGQAVITVKLSNPSIPVDVRQEGNQIIADFQGATLGKNQQRRLDVTDFATPVSAVQALNRGNDARLTIDPTPPFEFLAYQADNQYVIEVRPPQKSKEEDDKAALFDMSKKKYTGDLLSLNFQDIEVRAILQILADFTGLNIVVSDTVKGNLTLRLQNVPWDQALDIILRTKGLTKREHGSVIFIAPTEEIAAREKLELEREKLELESRKVVEDLVPLRTEIIQVNYAKANSLANLLTGQGPTKTTTVVGGAASVTEKGPTGRVLSLRGEAVADERTNQLIIKDVPEKLAEARELVTKLDMPSKQVMIDSRVVIASDDYARDIGVRFGVTGVNQTSSGINALSGSLAGTNTIVNSAVDNLTTTGQPFPVAVPSLADRIGVPLGAAPSGGGAPAKLAMAILGADYLVDLELSALQTEGKGEILSNPRVVTTDLKKATIVQGRQIPYSEVDDQGQVTTQFKDALLKLEVTPQITPDDRVRMDLVISKDDVGTNVPQATGGFVPSIDKREVQTQVLVNNGETVVLGGVFEQNKNKGNDKVPLLGDIPLLGYLFQRNSTNTIKRELLIFVTPQILKEGSGAVAER